MQAALDPALLATDLADYLVRRGVPFREAHGIVGRVVKRSIELGTGIDQLPLNELTAISSIFDRDVTEVFDFGAAIDRRNVAGGTGQAAVRSQLAQAKDEWLKHKNRET
jgi:argininosuccinate lyase